MERMEKNTRRNRNKKTQTIRKMEKEGGKFIICISCFVSSFYYDYFLDFIWCEPMNWFHNRFSIEISIMHSIDKSIPLRHPRSCGFNGPKKFISTLDEKTRLEKEEWDIFFFQENWLQFVYSVLWSQHHVESSQLNIQCVQHRNNPFAVRNTIESAHIHCVLSCSFCKYV